MAGDLIDSLTPKERDCLRLVDHDRKSAVIAAELGIAVPTVETHLRSARAKLGGVSRFVAARMLLEHEARQSMTSQEMTIVPAGATRAVPIPGRSDAIGSQPLVMADARPVFDTGFEQMPVQPPRAPRTSLNALNRLALMAFCLLALVVAGIAAIPLSDAVQDVARMVMKQRTD